MSDDPEATRDNLCRIAAILGVTVDGFYDAREPAALFQCLELLQRIRSEEGMKQALDCLERIARQENMPSGSDL